MSQRSIKSVVIAVLVVILAVCAFFYAKSANRTEQATQREAPDFSLKDSSGQVHTLQEGRGKLVLVHFWASWCPPCLQEAPDFLEFAAKYQDRPLQIFAISLDEKWSDAEKVLASKKLPKNIISLLDPTTKVPEAYGTYQFPETYLITSDGHILTKWVGVQPWSAPGMQEVIDAALKQVALR
jgi:peroxiredoxin